MKRYALFPLALIGALTMCAGKELYNWTCVQTGTETVFICG